MIPNLALHCLTAHKLKLENLTESYTIRKMLQNATLSGFLCRLAVGVALFGVDKHRIVCPRGVRNCKKLRENRTFGTFRDMEKTGMSATNVKVIEKRLRSASLPIQRRRQRLIALRTTAKRFSVGKASEALGVSRWTVERDLAFLEKHDLLSIRRSCAFPFERQESGEEFMRRFQAAHRA